MKYSKWVSIILIANLALIGWGLIRFCNLLFPMVGHDYRYFIPRIVDTYLHYRIDGLAIQWYTPSFGGGLPAFPNPQNIQFSLPQILTFLTEPWKAVLLSMIVYMTLGLLAGYYFFQRVLRLHWTSSILGAVFFIPNGFYMQHMSVGHLNFQAFPLLPILAISVLDISIPWPIAGLSFAFVMTILLHQAGFYLAIIFGLSMLIILPLVYIYKPIAFSWKQVRYVMEWGGILTILLLVSKISAVYSFMRLFPRLAYADYPTGIIKGLCGISMQLCGTMFLAPFYWLTGNDLNALPDFLKGITGTPFDFWELDTSMSPVVFGILVLGVILFLRNSRRNLITLTAEKKWVAWILLILAMWTGTEFTLAKGWIYPHIHKFPFIRSLYVNVRFASAFIFPLAILVAIIFDRWALRWGSRKSLIIFFVLNAGALMSLVSFFLFHPDLQRRSFDITESIKTYNAALTGETFPIEAVEGRTEENESVVFRRHLSSRYPYEPIFGYGLENFHPETKEGSIWHIAGGYYNFTNPTGFVFPEINGTRPFERIRVSEREKLAAFAIRHQPNWKIPLWQQAFNWVSALSFVFVVVFPIAYRVTQKRTKIRQIRSM